MSRSLVKNLVHLVYSTKHRQPWLPGDVRDGLFANQAGIVKSDCRALSGRRVLGKPMTQGGATLCPGLTCRCPFGAFWNV
jgi:hypothetical protein